MALIFVPKLLFIRKHAHDPREKEEDEKNMLEQEKEYREVQKENEQLQKKLAEVKDLLLSIALQCYMMSCALQKEELLASIRKRNVFKYRTNTEAFYGDFVQAHTLVQKSLKQHC